MSWTAQCQAEHCLGQDNVKLSTVLDSTMISGALSWAVQCQAEHCLGQHNVKLSPAGLGQHNVKRSTVLDSAMSSGALHVLDSTMSS